MKNSIILIWCLTAFFSLELNAQLRPAQSQYLKEKGALINPSFEQGFKGWTITGCTKTLVSGTPLLNKSLKLTCVNETFSIKQETTKFTAFKDQQLAYSFQVKSSANGAKFSGLENGSRVGIYDILTSTTYKNSGNIGLVAGATSNGVEVFSDTNFTGEIIVDDFSLTNKELIREISGASFVGSFLTADSTLLCVNTRNSSTYGGFSVDPDCSNNQTVIGSVSAPDTNVPAVKILNARTDGHYSVSYQGLSYTNGTGDCLFQLSSTSSPDGNGIAYTANPNARASNTIVSDFRFSTTGSKQIQLIAKSAGVQCNSYGTDTYPRKFTVHFFPDDTSTIVTQDTELTAKTANEIDYEFSCSGSSSIVKDSYDSGATIGNVSGGACVFDYTSLGLTTAPTVQLTDRSGSGSQLILDTYSATTTQVNVRCRVNGGGACGSWSGFLSVSKQGADVNKSQTIIGNFNNVNSSESVVVEARGSSGSSITGGTPIDFLETYDPQNTFDGTTFTAPKNGVYSFTVGTQYTSSTGSDFDLRKNGSLYIGLSAITSNLRIPTTVKVRLIKNDTVTFTETATRTISTNVLRHILTITQSPDYESVIANLSKQKTKCQTKNILVTGTAGATGIITDLSFSNLKIGKRYKIVASMLSTSNSGSVLDSYIYTRYENGSTILDEYRNRFTGGSSWMANNHNQIFVATDPTLNMSLFASSSNMYRTINGSYARLCELPDSVIETTEF